MDVLYFSLYVIALLTPSFGTKVTFENSTRLDVTEGSEANFKCVIDQTAHKLIQNPVQIIHLNPVTSKETILFKGGEAEEGKPEFYQLDFKYNYDLDVPKYEFVIKKVRYVDDGKFLCRYTEGSETVTAEREVVVHRPLSALLLKFGDHIQVAKTPGDPLVIDPGKYNVSCIAEGSNPATKDLDLYLDENRVEVGDVDVGAMDGTERRFRTSVAGVLDIMISNSGQDVECQARDSLGNLFSTKLTLEVNFYEPEVDCPDVEAYLDQDNPVVSCRVNHTNIDITSYRFQIGDTGDIITEGDQNDKHFIVTVKNVEPGISVVSLDLHKANRNYLNKNYYILIDVKGGHTVKESVWLKGKDLKDPNGATKLSLTTSLLCVVICVLPWSH